MGVIVKIFEHGALVFSTNLQSKLEIGRQQRGEPEPYAQIATDGGSRLIIEQLTEATVSRKHVALELIADDRVRVVNQSTQLPVMTNAQQDLNLDHEADSGQTTDAILPAGEQVELALPFLVRIGSKTIRVEHGEVAGSRLQGLANMTLAPGNAIAPMSSFVQLLGVNRSDSIGESVLDWLQKTMEVFQRSAGSSDFLPHAARAVLETVGLDVAAILLWTNGDWHIETVAMGHDGSNMSWRPSKTILNQVRAEKRTFRQLPEQGAEILESLIEVCALVAAPILNSTGDVIGAIYGDRRKGILSRQNITISPLEAKLVELLACGVAAGLARLDQEQAAIAARVQFERFFSPELARELEKNADMLTGRDTEVTLLVGDIRGFSRISERLGPQRTVAWINDALQTFSECVFQEEGVLVDYVGDELFAMWGAPVPREDHAERCCRAGLAMQRSLPELNAKWQEELGESFAFGVGINTGIARVGNVGTLRKFKYGPLGNTVNLTSRVQGATKFLRTSLLVTDSTAARLDERFAKRRLCKVRAVNILEPIELYELVDDARPEWLEMRDRYEMALTAFENRDFHQAAQILGSLVTTYPHDGPSMLLLSRAANLLLDDQTVDFSPVWELPGK